MDQRGHKELNIDLLGSHRGRYHRIFVICRHRKKFEGGCLDIQRCIFWGSFQWWTRALSKDSVGLKVVSGLLFGGGSVWTLDGLGFGGFGVRL